MNLLRRKRQLLFFLIAVMLPAVVLVGVTVRLFHQEAELSEKRIADERRGALEQVRRELAARLEAVKFREISRLVRSPAGHVTERPADSALIFAGSLGNERFVAPWETGLKPSLRGRSRSEQNQKGEAAEFLKGSFLDAAGFYRQALAEVKSPSEECEVRLAIGRALIKAEKRDEARGTYDAMLDRCGSLADEDGISYRMYAAERLLKNGLDTERARRFVVEEANSRSWRPPLELYFIRKLLEAAAGEGIDQARQKVSAGIHETEEVVRLEGELPRIRARLETSAETSPGDSVWVAYGDEPWLITIAPPSSPLPSLIFAVSSQSVAPPEARFVTTTTSGSELLGAGFPGLGVLWQRDRSTDSAQRDPALLYAVGVALILGVALLGGYLLLRDVNRDVRLAEMRSHFVASVSHELKTPLTAIRMFTEILALGRSESPQTTSEYLQTILHETERLRQLVDNVLDFSRIEQDSRIYSMRPTLLPDVVRSAARAMRYPLAQEGFAFNVSIDEQLPALPADPAALEQAILNLLTNAMKYSGESRRLDLLLKRADGAAAIEVRDWGVGIPPAEQVRIFEKFYRVRSAETETITGTGLGLTLVAHIVQAHGGSVDVRSAPGQGSTFAIRIPLQTSQVPA